MKKKKRMALEKLEPPPTPAIEPSEPAISYLGAIQRDTYLGRMDPRGMGLREADPVAGQPFSLITLMVPAMGLTTWHYIPNHMWGCSYEMPVLLYGAAYKTRLHRNWKYWLIRGHPWMVWHTDWFRRYCIEPYDEDYKKWKVPFEKHSPMMILACPFPEWIRPAPVPPSHQKRDEIITQEISTVLDHVRRKDAEVSSNE